MTRSKRRAERAERLAAICRGLPGMDHRPTLRDEINWRTDGDLGSLDLEIVTDMVMSRLKQFATADDIVDGPGGIFDRGDK